MAISISGHELGLEGLDALSGVDSLCLFVGEDERPLSGISGYVDWRLCGALSRVLLRGFFTGAEGDTLLLPTAGRLPMPRVFVVGVGRSSNPTPERVGQALHTAAAMLSRAKVQGVALELPGSGSLDDKQRVTALSGRFVPDFSGQRVAILGEKALTRMLPGSAGK